MTIRLAVSYLLLAAFLIAQRVMRRGEQARSLDALPADRGSTRILGVAFGLGLLGLFVAPVLNAWGRGTLEPEPLIGGVGLIVQTGGLGLRLWSQVVLGKHYTSTLRHTDGQAIVDSGPYSVLRHPGYSGMLLAWIGAGLATANWVVTMSLALLMVAVYQYRIMAEESMLGEAFGDNYREYSRRTWRLVPLVY